MTTSSLPWSLSVGQNGEAALLDSSGKRFAFFPDARDAEAVLDLQSKTKEQELLIEKLECDIEDLQAGKK